MPPRQQLPPLLGLDDAYTVGGSQFPVELVAGSEGGRAAVCVRAGAGGGGVGVSLTLADAEEGAAAGGGIGLLFLAGWFFTEVHPLAIVIRGQLFRASRLMMVLAFIVIARACVAAWRLLRERPDRMPAWAAWLEAGSALLTALSVAVPSLIQLLPWALLAAVVVALINGRLAWHEAVVAGGALLICVFAFVSIHFGIPGLSASGDYSAQMLLASIFKTDKMPTLGGWVLLAVATGVGVVFARQKRSAFARGGYFWRARWGCGVCW